MYKLNSTNDVGFLNLSEGQKWQLAMNDYKHNQIKDNNIN